MNEITYMTIKGEDAVKPMKHLIGIASSYGYELNDNLKAYDQVKQIRKWMYEKHFIWTWLTYSHQRGFTPYYINIAKPQIGKEKTYSSHFKEEALTEILIKAIKSL